MDLEVQAQQLTVQPQWMATIDHRVAKFRERFPELMRLHVTLRHSTHHQQGAEEVEVLANVAGAALRAAKCREDMGAALRAALDAIERELHEHHRLGFLHRRGERDERAQ